MSNIKLKNQLGEDIILNGIHTISAPLADGSGTAEYTEGGGGGVGTYNYEDLENKPMINGVELFGNLTEEDLHIVGQTGPQGPQGEAGPRGPKGDQGPAGNGIAETILNDDYTLTIVFTDGTSHTTEPIRGEQGIQGPQGEQGIQGEPGEKGDKGDDGTSFKVNGLYATYEELIAAHPTGEVGEAYAVGSEESSVVYIWDADHTEWKNIGSIQGPKGEKGEDGSVVSVSAEGTSKEEVKYITIDGVEKKISGAGSVPSIELDITEEGDIALTNEQYEILTNEENNFVRLINEDEVSAVFSKMIAPNDDFIAWIGLVGENKKVYITIPKGQQIAAVSIYDNPFIVEDGQLCVVFEEGE